MPNKAPRSSENLSYWHRAVATYRSLPRSVQVFLVTDLALLSFASACEAISRFWLRLGHPYDTPLLWDYFPDLVNLRPRFGHFHTLQFFTDQVDLPFMYPAPIALFYRLFFLFRPYDLGILLTFITCCALAATILFGGSLIARGLGKKTTVLFLSFVLLTSYPLWVEIKQANMEIVVWCIVVAGIYLFLEDKHYLAAACFGAAGALKLFPFIYLGLLIARRQYRQVALSVAVAVLVTVPSLWLVYPHILESWHLTNAAVAQFGPVESLQFHVETGTDHSIFGFIKNVVFLSGHPLTSHLLKTYLVIAAAAGLAIFFFLIRKLPVINQILCLCVVSISFPPTSYDYTLMHLYIPWALLTLFALRPENARRLVSGLSAAFCCFGILFVPQTEIILFRHSFGGQFKCLILILLLLVGLIHPFGAETNQYGQETTTTLDGERQHNLSSRALQARSLLTKVVITFVGCALIRG